MAIAEAYLGGWIGVAPGVPMFWIVPICPVCFEGHAIYAGWAGIHFPSAIYCAEAKEHYSIELADDWLAFEYEEQSDER